MAVFRPKIVALVGMAIVGAVLAYPQERRGGGQAGRRSQSPERSRQKVPAPKEEARKGVAPERFIRDAEVVVISLKHADARELRGVLSALSPAIGRRVLVNAVGRDSLVVAADDEKTLAKVKDLVAEVDRQQREYGCAKVEVCEAVSLKNAYAKDVKEYLQELAPERPSPARIVADERANTVWIAGAKQDVSWLVDLAREMDENVAAGGLPEDEDAPVLRFYTVEHADAVALAEILVDIGEPMGLDAAVAADPASKMLVTYATAAAHAQLETIVKKFDVPAKQPRKRPPAAPRKREGQR